MSLTKEEKLLGDLFRDAIYTATTTSEFLELFSLKILENFDSDDFLILQLGSQLYESAQIRKTDELYMDMQTKITTECYNLISRKYPEISFYSSQRFKSAISEIYKRCERIFDEGRSPEIRVFPYFEEGQMVLNIKTLQTRIVKAVMALEKGKLVVYNNDCPDEAELQEQGYVSIIPEEWNIRDCVPVNSKEARKEGFQFGTEMGVHPKYSEMQAREMGM